MRIQLIDQPESPVYWSDSAKSTMCPQKTFLISYRKAVVWEDMLYFTLLDTTEGFFQFLHAFLC